MKAASVAQAKSTLSRSLLSAPQIVGWPHPRLPSRASSILASTRSSIRRLVGDRKRWVKPCSHGGMSSRTSGGMGDAGVWAADVTTADGHGHRHSGNDELEHFLRLVDVLQLSLARRLECHALWQMLGHDRARRFGQQNLSATGSGGNARRPDDVEARIALVAHNRFARVQTKPDAHRHALRPGLGGVCALNCDCAGYRFACPRERVEERITLGVHLLAVVGGERLAHEPAVRRQRFGVAASPSCLSRLVLPSMSLKTNVTVPVGSCAMGCPSIAG